MATAGAVVPFNPQALISAFQQTKQEANVGAGAQYLRFQKDGEWVIFAGAGEDGEPVGNGARYIVNIESFGKGYIAWGLQSNKIGESFVRMVEALPDPGPLTEQSKQGWQYQLGFALRELGEGGAEMIFRSSALGGKKAVMALMGDVVDRLKAGDPACFPVVTLDSDHYIHKKHGKIYTPEFTVERWLTKDQVVEAAKGTPPRPPRQRAPGKRARQQQQAQAKGRK